MHQHYKVQRIGTHPEARAVARAIRVRRGLRFVSRADARTIGRGAYATSRALATIADVQRGVDTATAADILSAMRTGRGRDAVLLVMLGMSPGAAAHDPAAGDEYFARIFSDVHPLAPGASHQQCLDLMTYLCAVTPRRYLRTSYTIRAFCLWFGGDNAQARMFVNAARAVRGETRAMSTLIDPITHNSDPAWRRRRGHAATAN